jgi:hypothetical protein
MQALHSGIISIPGSPQTWTWKLPLTLASQIRENHKNVPKVYPRRLPKCILKSIKMYIWATVCPLGVPLDLRITKTVSQVPKMDPQGLQHNSSIDKKLPISEMTKSTTACIKSDPVQQSTSQQLPADWGPAAGAKP